MIKVENTEVYGWEAAIRGMRNPMNSWEKSDSCYCKEPITTKCNNLGCSQNRSTKLRSIAKRLSSKKTS